MYDEGIVQRFKAERQSLAMMDHPAIAKVFDAGTTPQGQPYLVMEYVAGLPITEYCDQKKLSVRQRLELFVQACDGVQHAHQKAIIHRDLKPPNILVVDVDGKPLPRIIDFGLAKASTPQAAGDERTHPVRTLPRDARIHESGAARSWRARRRHPYRRLLARGGAVRAVDRAEAVRDQAARPEQQPLDELLRKLREDEPPSPSAKVHSDRESSAAIAEARSTDRRQLVSLLRGDLDCITSRALDRDRAADATARPPNWPPTFGATSTMSRCWRAPTALAIGCAPSTPRRHRDWPRAPAEARADWRLLLAAFGVLQAVELRHTTHERDRANYERDRALSLAARNRAVQDFLDLLITEAAQSDKPVSVSDMLARSELLAASEFHDDPENHAAVLDMPTRQSTTTPPETTPRRSRCCTRLWTRSPTRTIWTCARRSAAITPSSWARSAGRRKQRRH